MAALEQSWSVMVRIVSYPNDKGSLVMKSRAMVSKGLMCRVVMGNKGGVGFVGLFFHDWHRAQPLI